MGPEMEFDWDEANIGHGRSSRARSANSTLARVQGHVLLVVTTRREDRVRVVTAFEPIKVLLPGTREVIPMAKKQPPFKTEAEEAEWWAKNQELIANRFEQAKAAGKLGKGTVARVARKRASEGASPTITIRLAEDDLTRARAFAAEKGLRYQTYLKMLLHQALNSEEQRAGRR